MKKKYLGYLLASGLCVVLCGGCAQQTETLPRPAQENPAWQVVSTDAEDFGIIYDAENFDEVADYPLDKLVAYCLDSDGIFAEEAFGTLYQRFLEAPHTCISYFALIQEEEAVNILLEHISLENAYYAEMGQSGSLSFTGYYEWPERFQSIVEELTEIYPNGREAEIVTALQTFHTEAIKEN